MAFKHTFSIFFFHQYVLCCLYLCSVILVHCKSFYLMIRHVSDNDNKKSPNLCFIVVYFCVFISSYSSTIQQHAWTHTLKVSLCEVGVLVLLAHWSRDSLCSLLSAPALLWTQIQDGGWRRLNPAIGEGNFSISFHLGHVSVSHKTLVFAYISSRCVKEVKCTSQWFNESWRFFGLHESENRGLSWLQQPSICSRQWAVWFPCTSNKGESDPSEVKGVCLCILLKGGGRWPLD